MYHRVSVGKSFQVRLGLLLGVVVPSCILLNYLISTRLGSVGRSSQWRLTRHTLPPKRSTLERELASLGPLMHSAEAERHTTLVAVHFDLRTKDRTKNATKYDTWLANMARSVTRAAIVLFCDEATMRNMQRALSESTQAPTRTPITFVVYDSIWSMLKELERARQRPYRRNYVHAQLKLRDDPRLYALFNLKVHALQRVATNHFNPYNSTFFVYTDSGVWREEAADTTNKVDWPDERMVRGVERVLGTERMLFGQMKPNEPAWHCWFNVIAGAFYAGSARAVARLYRDYYDAHDRMLDKKDYVGDDQCMLTQVVYGGVKRSPEEEEVNKSEVLTHARIKLWLLNEADERCGSRQTFYRRFFAPANVYLCPLDRHSMIIERYNS